MKKCDCGDIEVDVAEVVDFLKLTGGFDPALSEVVERKVTTCAAKQCGLKVSAKELQQACDAFRVIYGLHKASETNKWLKETGITLEALESFIETNLLIMKYKESLFKKTPKAKYLSSSVIQSAAKEMVYRSWLRNCLE